MKQRILYILICLSAWIVSCDNEDNLSPTETPEIGYVVPQGDHDYDQKIVDWSERCNSFHPLQVQDERTLLGCKSVDRVGGGL